MNSWFVTWDRPEYKEWAREIENGYLLLVVRREANNFLCVKANLIMKEKGLPDFVVLEEKNFPTEEKAFDQIESWKKSS